MNLFRIFFFGFGRDVGSFDSCDSFELMKGYRMDGSADKAQNKQTSLGLREQAFNIKISDLKDIQPLGDYGIYGVIMEMGYPQGAGTVVCFITGDASVYFSNGGGMIGGIAHETVRKAGLNLVHASLNVITMLQKTEVHPFPREGWTIFYVLTKDGMYAAQAMTNDLGKKLNPLSPLFYAGNEVITAFRLIDQAGQGK